MNFKRGIILLCLFLLVGFYSNAQVSLSAENLSSLNIDDLSDKEIRTYMDKARQNNVKEDLVYTVLAEKGLPSGEISKLKERVAKINEADATDNEDMGREDASLDTRDTDTDNKSEGKEIDQSKKYDRRSSKDPYSTPMKLVKPDLTVFGSELFTANSLVFEPNLRIPTPSGYILGPDDELIINVFGFSEKTYNVTVNPEGSIFIPQAGPIFVNGLSIEQASSRIRSKMAATIYKAINSGKTSVQITLGKIRSVRVTVIGEAKKPGTYTVSSLTTLFNLLYLCGGPTDMGSYRNIELIRGNQLKRKVDLYAFLLKGNQQDNLLLQEGDVIRIPYYTKRVLLNGKVKHKGKYEVTDKETFQDLLGFSGGFADDAYKGSVTIYQLTEKERKIADLVKDQYGTYEPMTSDSIVVGKLSDRFANKLTIKGAIVRPGEYELGENTSLKELIEKAGGVKEDVYSKRGSISRLNFNRTPVQLSFDIDSVLSDKVKIALRKEDSVTIYSIFDLQNEKKVSVDGQVKKPGYYKWAENLSLNDLILTAGGLTEFGDPSSIEIARVLKNVDVSKPNYAQTEIININVTDSAGLRDIVLEPFDAVIIKQKSSYGRQRSVLVEGMVLNPGRYALRTSGDKISDLMKRVGGFRSNADSASLIIRRYSGKDQSTEEREKVLSKLLNIKQDSILANERIKNEIYKNYDKISIDLSKVLSDPGVSENMTLEDGDVISIDRNTNLVKVSGEVYFPTLIPYQKKTNLKYYIQKSGSYTPSARKKATMIIYADGRAKRVKHFLFFKIYPKVESRAEIFVPQKAPSNKDKISTGEWALIVSAMAIVANVLINAKW